MLSPQCEKVLAVLEQSSHPLSAYDVLDQLRESGIKSPPTVYRALDKLTAEGLAHRIESLNAYVACHHKHGHSACHHGGAVTTLLSICTSCGKVKEMEAPQLDEALHQLKGLFLSQISRKVVELFGLCAACQKKVKV